MARPGVTYNDVTKAALELTGQGKLPTIDNIRQILGTGSSSTIAPHLRTWKAKQGETQLIASKEKLPEDFVALMKGLWERVLQEAQTQISMIEQHADKNLSELKQQIENLVQENKYLQQQCNLSSQKEQQLANDKLALEQAITQCQNELIALQAESKTFQQRLVDKQDRIDEVQRLNQQTQNNLEHYRESAREQRLKEQQQHEQQIKYFEQSTRQYLRENNQLREQLQDIQEKFKQIQQDNQNLKGNNHVVTLQLGDAKKTVETLLKNENYWETQYRNVLGKFEDQQKLIPELQKQLALLSQQLSTAEKQLNEISHQNKLLAHEKWQLGQEAAQLMGQLKKIELINQR
jgi:chromosome segregation ATPase